MTPEKFARMFLALNIPLTEEEWWGLNRLFEELYPDITVYLTGPKKVGNGFADFYTTT